MRDRAQLIKDCIMRYRDEFIVSHWCYEVGKREWNAYIRRLADDNEPYKNQLRSTCWRQVALIFRATNQHANI